MKTNLSLFLISSAAYLSGCVATVSFDAVQPAPVDIPTAYKKVVILNRTGSDKQYQSSTQLEGFLTGEWFKQDKKITFFCLEGLADYLVGSMKKYETEIITDSVFKGTGTEIFPETFSPDFVSRICKKYKADFLIALEAYDIDIISKVNGTPVTFNVLDIATATPAGPTYTLRTVVKSGWRIYPANSAALIDQYMGKTTYDFSAMNVPDQAVLLGLPASREVVNKTSRFAGNNYADRITPEMITIHRNFYKSGNAAMKEAARFTYVSKWGQAFDIWQQNMNSPKKKVAWRSMYNMAVNYEVTGNLDEAIKMAESAYVKYRKRPALDYANNLKRRQEMINQANQQLGENK